jgi:hypothetical protein
LGSSAASIRIEAAARAYADRRGNALPSGGRIATLLGTSTPVLVPSNLAVHSRSRSTSARALVTPARASAGPSTGSEPLRAALTATHRWSSAVSTRASSDTGRWKAVCSRA